MKFTAVKLTTVKLNLDRIAKELAEIRQRVETVEHRQIASVVEKADRMSREIELNSAPISAIPTTVERQIRQSVEEFKVSRRIDDVKSVEFDREHGLIRVIYRR